MKLESIQEKVASGRVCQMERIVVERVNQCTGWPVKKTNVTWGESKRGAGRGTCAHCGGSTQWYCVGCKRYLCIEPTSKATTMDGFFERWKIDQGNASASPIYCFGSCFLQTHQSSLVSSQNEATRRLVAPK